MKKFEVHSQKNEEEEEKYRKEKGKQLKNNNSTDTDKEKERNFESKGKIEDDLDADTEFELTSVKSPVIKYNDNGFLTIVLPYPLHPNQTEPLLQIFQQIHDDDTTIEKRGSRISL